jgi:hypothetical protein
MYCVLLALVATSASLSPAASPPDHVTEAGVTRRAGSMDQIVRRDDGRQAEFQRTYRLAAPAAKQRLERLWIPLPCSRSGSRMVC